MVEARKRPTAADVARRSGVSSATVSYVLNKTPEQTIPPATRDRVLAAAEELGYVPSAYAQALAKGRSRIVVIDLSDIPHGEAIARFGREVATALDARGYLPIVDQPTRSPGDPHARLLALASTLAPTMVISATSLPDDIRERLATAGVEHFAALLPRADGFEKRVDDAAHAQVAYLSTRQHRTIAYCGTDESHLSAPDGIRRAAVIDEAAARGIHLVDLGSHHLPESIADALTSARRRFPDLSAVAAYNDETALAVLSAALRLGLSIPAELAVIGIDDTPLAAMTFPSLTSVGFANGTHRSVEEYIDLGLADEPTLPSLTTRITQRDSA